MTVQGSNETKDYQVIADIEKSLRFISGLLKQKVVKS